MRRDLQKPVAFFFFLILARGCGGVKYDESDKMVNSSNPIRHINSHMYVQLFLSYSRLFRQG